MFLGPVTKVAQTNQENLIATAAHPSTTPPPANDSIPSHSFMGHSHWLARKVRERGAAPLAFRHNPVPLPSTAAPVSGHRMIEGATKRPKRRNVSTQTLVGFLVAYGSLWTHTRNVAGVDLRTGRGGSGLNNQGQEPGTSCCHWHPPLELPLLFLPTHGLLPPLPYLIRCSLGGAMVHVESGELHRLRDTEKDTW